MMDTYLVLLTAFVGMPLAMFAGIVIGQGIATLDDEKEEWR